MGDPNTAIQVFDQFNHTLANCGDVTYSCVLDSSPSTACSASIYSLSTIAGQPYSLSVGPSNTATPGI